jgi:hypothetical protein
MMTMTATQLHAHLRHFAADYWGRRSSMRSVDAEKQLTSVLNGLVEKGVIRSWTGLEATVPSAYCEEQKVCIHVEVQSMGTVVERWELDVAWPPPGKDNDALLVVDLAKRMDEFVAQGRGDYYVVHPGVAGDIYCTYVYLDEEDEWTVCVITDDDEKVLSKRERFAEAGLKLPTILEWQEMQKDLKARDEELERNDAFFRRMSEKLDTETIDIETLEAAFNDEVAAAERVTKRLENFILIRPGDVMEYNVELDSRTTGAVLVEGMKVFMGHDELIRMTELVREGRKEMFGALGNTEEPQLRALYGMEDAFTLLRAKLLEHEPEALVDNVLMVGLREVIGDEWYQHLVDNTSRVLSKSVKLPPKNSIASDDYVHLKPTRSDFGQTVKTILFCGAAISESSPPPTTHSAKKATCPNCLVAYERKWQAYMDSKKPKSDNAYRVRTEHDYDCSYKRGYSDCDCGLDDGKDT